MYPFYCCLYYQEDHRDLYCNPFTQAWIFYQKLPFDASLDVSWSLSGYNEQKLPKMPLISQTIQGLLFHINAKY